jgi:hypothetical protein
MDDAYMAMKLRLTHLLSDVPLMRSGDRDVVLQELRAFGFSLSASADSTDSVVSMRVVEWCLQERGAFRRLLRLLEVLDKSSQFRAFASVVDSLPPSDIYSFRERAQFIAELTPLVPTAELQGYYRAVADQRPGAGGFEPRALTGVSDLVTEVEQLTFHESCHPIIVLTEAVAQQSRQPGAAQIARAWGDQLARNLDEADPVGDQQGRLAELRGSKISQPARATGRAVLVVQLEPYGPEQRKLYLFSATLYRGHTLTDRLRDNSDAMSLEKVRSELSKVLGEAIERVETEYPEVLNIDLEFVLPRSLLCEPIEEWINGESPYQRLKEQHLVVVRDFKRQHDSLLRFQSRRKWQHMINNDNGTVSCMTHWITCADPQRPPGQLYRELNPDGCSAVGLTFPPLPGVRGFEFNEVLDACTPIAVWPRRRCEHTGAGKGPDEGPCAGMLFKESLCDRFTGKRLQDLPQFVLGLRTEVTSDPGWGMTLLWDDPGRPARPRVRSLDAPWSGGAS